ncbi:MAG: DUF1080 domain-containing protein [Tannerella sp.]|jgi:hypothetical protein|nr:DUF1080 domain-containing protein [Tannerella sp.]
MRTIAINAAILVCLFITSCQPSGSRVLFDSTNTNKWQTTGSVSTGNGILTLQGGNTQAVLKSGRYKNFELNLELRTTAGGKGFIAFHTDKTLSKGYRVAINNDRSDPVWWKMTGSLLSVRNLTKSFVKENDWFQMSIRVEGNFIAVAINGAPVVEYIQPAEPYRIAPNQAALLSEGTIALTGSGTGEIQIKSISIQTIQPGEMVGDINTQLAQAIDEQKDEIIKLHQEDFPVLDYHVHIKGGLTNENAAQRSRKTGINYAASPNCGVGFPITDDSGVIAFLDSMRSKPFILAMQAEGREWVTTFSPQVRNEFDYVFTDALTFTDTKGRRTRLWMPREVWIDNEQRYMDMIVDKICGVLKEPMDMYVNPCFLPPQMEDRYDEFWTEARMNKFVEAMALSGKALEINARYKIPNKAIIQKAKAAGVKFTFGTNNAGADDLGLLEYCIQIKKECGITAQDMYKPKVKI